MRFIRTIVLPLLCFSFFTMASDSDVEDAINSGLAHYKKGELSQAAAQLNYAATLIQQKKADEIVNIFPEPLDGWQADEASSESAGAMMMGGGITARRYYYNGDQNIEIELVVDSPMLQAMLGMFNNPQLIAMSGKRLIKINGQNAVLDQQGDDIELVFVVNNNAMFTLRAYQTKRKVVEQYASSINTSKL